MPSVALSCNKLGTIFIQACSLLTFGYLASTSFSNFKVLQNVVLKCRTQIYLEYDVNQSMFNSDIQDGAVSIPCIYYNKLPGPVEDLVDEAQHLYHRSFIRFLFCQESNEIQIYFLCPFLLLQRYLPFFKLPFSFFFGKFYFFRFISMARDSTALDTSWFKSP